MIALYIVAIVVVCGLLVFYFFWSARKHKRMLDVLKIEKTGGVPAKKEETEVKEDLKKVEKEVVKEEKKIEAELEDFIWDDSPKDKPAESDERKYKFGGDDELLRDIEDNMFETKMDAYEQFLKEEQKSYAHEEELTKEEQSDIDALMSFDFDSLKGKTREQVSQMIKDLSPAVQDFILNDIFERKNNED